MRTVISVLFALFLISLPLIAVAAEGPMELPAGSNSGADMHNKAGIKNWNEGNIEGALKHFQEASAEDKTIAETHFNEDRKSTRLNSSHALISYAVFCLKKKKETNAN